MGKAGRSLAEREFSIGNVVDRHLEIYEELMKQAGRRKPLLKE
jgi:hypothetical protein